MRLALFEPDIPQNTGTLIRLGAVLKVPLDIIEPCGFLFSDRALRRSGLDYRDRAEIVRHQSWEAFRESLRGERLLLLTAKAADPYTGFAFRPDDVLLLGRESAGAPPHVHDAAAARLRIPMAAGERSINMALAAAMVLGEALRQTGGFAS